LNNFRILTGKSFNPAKGFMNSLIISVGVCICSLYFSTLTAYSLVMYEWKLKNVFFGFIMGILQLLMRESALKE
jgi:multiple sugar transport system permease protein